MKPLISQLIIGLLIFSIGKGVDFSLKKGSKAANRRKSYCARSAGQMKKFPKAARDPNSRLRQARRRWKC